MKHILRSIRHFFNFGEDKLPEQEIVSSISADVDFHGAKLWLLIIAVFVASLGLNTNSTAVIIGAMLISPLMGPIIGMGLGVGIYDFTLFRKSVHNYVIATLFSVITATLYFLVTPITQAQSELLARTSPTIYDVCIALCGGLAGIIAVCSRSQHNGNVIPGVAIATALMPPLCTVGYGIATANWSFALGAMYLYLINTVFIAFSTSVCVAFILKFDKKKVINKEHGKRVRRIIISIALVTMIPSIFLTYRIVRSTIYEQHVSQFVDKEMNFDDAQVVRYKTSSNDSTVQIMLLGSRVDSTRILVAKSRLADYGLKNTRLQVIQGNEGLRDIDIKSFLSDYDIHKTVSITQAAEKTRMADNSIETVKQIKGVIPEMKTLYPSITSVAVSRGEVIEADSAMLSSKATVVLVTSSPVLPEKEGNRLRSWLRQRTGIENMIVLDVGAKDIQ